MPVLDPPRQVATDLLDLTAEAVAALVGAAAGAVSSALISGREPLLYLVPDPDSEARRDR
jgi:hypothetical protein